MEAVLAALEGSAPAQFLKTSYIAYPLVSAAHVLAVGALVSFVVLLDLRVLRPGGRLAVLPEPLLRRIAIGAFFAAVPTGLALFSIQANDYAANPAFRVKLALLLAAGINLALFFAFRQRAPGRARAFAATSLLIWPAILVAGRFIGFV